MKVLRCTILLKTGNEVIISAWLYIQWIFFLLLLKDLKPGEMLQTTGKGIVTYGIVKDRMVIVGKTDGSVEAIPLDKLNRWTCKVRDVIVGQVLPPALTPTILSGISSGVLSELLHMFL